MAQALVNFLATSRHDGFSSRKCIYAVTFLGADVSEEIATGLQPQIEIAWQTNYGLSDLKGEIIAAVLTMAPGLGLSIVATDIFIQSYETGS